MSYIPKVWQARQGTNLNKFTKSSETSTSVILQNAPDAITVPGTPFTAAAMNNIEAGIQNTHVLGPWESVELTTGLTNPFGMATDGVYLYVTEYITGKVKKILISTGVATELTTGLSVPYGIVTDGTYLYVIEHSTGKVKKILISTGVATELTTGLAAPYGIATDGIYLYVTEPPAGKVKKISLGTGVATELTTGLSEPFCISTDGTYLYVTESAAGKVKRILISTGVSTELTTGLSEPFGISTDGTYLYVTETAAGKVKRILISTGVATELTTGLANPFGITTDDACLYVIEYNTGKIKTLAPTAEYIAPSKILTQSVTTANVTVTEDRFGNILLSGTLTGNRDVVLPSTVRVYKVINNCTGSYYVRIKTASGTGVYMASGDVCDAYCDGTNVVPIRTTRKSAVLIAGTPNVPLAANSETKILSLSASNDALGEWDAANNRFVPKSAGILSISFRGKFDSLTGRLAGTYALFIKKNGSSQEPATVTSIDGPSGSSWTTFPCGTVVVPVEAGDYIEFYCVVDATTDTRFGALSARITQIS